MALYKYLSPDRVDVLRDARIRFTQPNALNDPFELKPFFKTIFNMDTFRETIRSKMDFRPALLNKYEEMPSDVRTKLSPDQFVSLALQHMEQNKSEYEALFNKNIDEMIDMMPALSVRLRSILHGGLGSGVGILSLSEDSVSDLMWAHYARDHSGFVVGFDENSRFFHSQRSDKDEFFRLRKVNYIGNRLSFESFEQMIDDENELFTSKLDSWEYEKEWRILIPLFERTPEIDATEPIHLFAYPRSAVRAVILGHKSSSKLRDDVCAIVDKEPEYKNVEKLVTYVDYERGQIALKAFT